VDLVLLQRLAALMLLLGAILLGGCEGDIPFGGPCGSDSDCRRGLCVAGVHGESPVCTRSCARSSECPEGWSCSGVTQHQVLVCSHGAATPFGH